MLSIYRSLLYLYPSAYRDEYGEEMMAVFDEVQAEIVKKRLLARAVSHAREAGGLLCGSVQEHVRSIVGSYGGSMFSSRRLTMRSELRFPKATAMLMPIILGAVIVAIDKARAIQASVPYANPYVGSIQRAQFTVLRSLLLTLVAACVAGAIGWAILFALQRSGVHRFTEIDPSRGQRSGTKL
jgi:hypothetical protein